MVEEAEATTTWRSYEEVARYLLDRFKARLGLCRVEGKQVLPGASGTAWEIDAKAVNEDATSLLVECRRYENSKIPQSEVASLAFIIQDVGASGGILVSPLGLQSGAKKVAESALIWNCRLDANSTTEEFVLEILNNIFVGMVDHVEMPEETLEFVVRPASDVTIIDP